MSAPTREDREAAIVALYGGWEVNELRRALDWAARDSVNHWPLTHEEARDAKRLAAHFADHRERSTAALREAAERLKEALRQVGLASDGFANEVVTRETYVVARANLVDAWPLGDDEPYEHEVRSLLSGEPAAPNPPKEPV